MSHRAVTAVLVLLAAASPASTSTIAAVSGSGELSVTATGTVYFDTTALSLTDLTLTASSEIVLGDAYPIGVPGPTSTFLELPELLGTQQISVTGDLLLEPFAYTGSLSISADRIHAVGGLTTIDGPIVLDAGGGGTGGCDAGALVASTGGFEGRCVDGALVLLSLEDTVPEIVRPEIGLAPVPEPGAALLFGVGALAIAHVSRRPDRS